jgi:hypothetical protein
VNDTSNAVPHAPKWSLTMDLSGVSLYDPTATEPVAAAPQPRAACRPRGTRRRRSHRARPKSASDDPEPPGGSPAAGLRGIGTFTSNPAGLADGVADFLADLILSGRLALVADICRTECDTFRHDGTPSDEEDG